MRKIKSYVLRKGRLTAGQAYALQHYWDRFGIDYRDSLLDLDQEFGRRAPRILDIGVGTGDTTLALASSYPQNDYLAVDVHEPGLGSLIRRAEEKQLSNVRVICRDIIDVLGHQLPDSGFEHVYIFFPDPWPKKRHHKRRLVNREFLDLLLPKLSSHGRIFIATDWENLAEHILLTCDEYPGLRNMAGPGKFAPRPKWRPLTRFEQRGEKLDHEVYDFIYYLEHRRDQEKT